MNEQFKKIYFKQKFALIMPESVTEEPTERNKVLAMTVAANFGTYNMIMSSEMVDALSKASETDIVKFYDFYLPLIKEAIGADFEERRLFYPGFPEEVLEKDRIDIFLDQLAYAFSGLTMMPEEKPEMTYFPYIGEGIKKQLTVGSEEGFKEYVDNLLTRNMMWTTTEKEIIDVVLDEAKDIMSVLPEEPSKIKENNLYLLEQVKEREPEKFLDVAKRYLKTPTDVMRYAVTLVGGDPSLNGKMKDQIEIRGPWGVRSTKTIGFSFSKNPKYPDDTRNLKGSEIKEVLALLANTRMEIGSDYPEIEKMIKENARKEGRSDDIILVDDAVQTYAQYYKSLAKVAHLNPNDKSQVNRVLGAICSNKTRTIYSLIEKAIADKDVETAVKYLKYRPTELGRRLDKLCQIASETGKEKVVLEQFKEIASKASVFALLQMHGTFELRKYLQDVRTVNVDGNITKKDPKQPLKRSLCEKIQNIVMDALKEKYAEHPSLGKVYIDPSMAKVKIPKNNRMRNASDSLFPYTFGSSLPANNAAKTRQFAVKWENGNKFDEDERIDIDLSATGIFADGRTEHVGWNSDYRDGNAAIVYSGDIQKGGSAEFLNFNLDKLRESGYVGIAVNVNIYCGAKSFGDMLDCQMLMSERDDMHYGKTYEAKTVRNTIVPSGPAREVKPVVLNVETGEWIWLDDFDRNATNIASMNIGLNSTMILDAIQVNRYNPGFDILIAAQNCEIVNDIKEADIVYSQEPVDASLLKEGAQNITQIDYDKLVELLNENVEEEISKSTEER